MTRRPLSPFLNYRFAHTMVLSFLHRLTGVGMTAGLLVLVAWLVAASRGEAAYLQFQQWAGSIPMKLLLALWLIAFIYHLANGIRHLGWDAGYGLERAQARRSGLIVVTAVVLVSGPLIWALFMRSGA